MMAAARLAGTLLERLSRRPVEVLSAAWLLTLPVGYVGDGYAGLGLRWLLLAAAGFLIGVAWTGWLRQRADERARRRRQALVGSVEG